MGKGILGRGCLNHFNKEEPSTLSVTPLKTHIWAPELDTNTDENNGNYKIIIFDMEDNVENIHRLNYEYWILIIIFFLFIYLFVLFILCLFVCFSYSYHSK